MNLGLPVNVEQLRGLPEEKLAERLRLLGLPEAVVEHLSPDETTANLLPLKAPMDGIVVARQVVAGEVVDASRVLFQLADTSRMWLTLNVSAGRGGQTRPGTAGSLPARWKPGRSERKARLDQHHGRPADADGDGPRRIAQPEGTTSQRDVRSRTDHSARRARGDRGSQRSDPLGRLLPCRVRARQGVLRQQG